MTTWRSSDEPMFPPLTGMQWVRVATRGSLLAVVIFGCLGLLLLVRLVERPLFGLRRPATPYITRFVCRNALRIIGLKLKTQGRAMKHDGAVVANHSSWLDIFALNAKDRVYFVSKSEVAKWPGIGWLARATGTVFISRTSRDAVNQKMVFENRLNAGHRLVFFPEGTSTDGKRVLPFKPTLFAAFFADNLRESLAIQPVSVQYQAPADQDPRFYGWWGDMDFGPHLMTILAARNQGTVTVHYHPHLNVPDFADRKALAKASETAVRAGMAPE